MSYVTPDPLTARVAVASLAGIVPPVRLSGYVLVAVADTDEEPRVITDLPAGHVIAVLTSVAAVMANEQLEVEGQA